MLNTTFPINNRLFDFEFGCTKYYFKLTINQIFVFYRMKVLVCLIYVKINIFKFFLSFMVFIIKNKNKIEYILDLIEIINDKFLFLKFSLILLFYKVFIFRCKIKMNELFEMVFLNKLP